MISEQEYFHPQNAKFSLVDGFDISPVSLANAAKNTTAPFVPYCIDVNQIEMKDDFYDLVIGSHGIHHIAEIRHLFTQINDSLKTGGIFAFFEWIGPRYLQFCDESIPSYFIVVCIISF